MDKKMLRHFNFLIILLTLVQAQPTYTDDQALVQAILFFSPSCPHCHKVITEDLPPILDQYGEQLVILGINTYTGEGNELFKETLEYFNIPQEMAGVPMLIVGENVLIGSVDIPERLPGIISSGLASGGIGWPDIPGLDLVLQQAVKDGSDESAPGNEVSEKNPAMTPPGADARIDADPGEKDIDTNPGKENHQEYQTTSAMQIEESISAMESMTMAELFLQDSTGNILSTVVLTGMVFSVAAVALISYRSNSIQFQFPNWVVTLLLFVGFFVAGYMAYVEITQSEAICGPVGDCNTVQQSPYASLFGFIPVGLLGVVGFLLMGIVWLIYLFGAKNWQVPSILIFWVLSLFGTLFSIYLTFLEPFVIGATCAWCLTSAVVMTLLLWCSTTKVQNSGGLRISIQ